MTELSMHLFLHRSSGRSFANWARRLHTV